MSEPQAEASVQSAHTCHWPDCGKHVPPAMWGCKAHWFQLPKYLRDKVWATYRPGQEITKTPSAAYLAVAREVQGWIAGHKAGNATPPPTKRGTRPADDFNLRSLRGGDDHVYPEDT